MIHPTRGDRGQDVSDEEEDEEEEEEEESKDQRSVSDAMPPQTAPINDETAYLEQVIQEVEFP